MPSFSSLQMSGTGNTGIDDGRKGGDRQDRITMSLRLTPRRREKDGKKYTGPSHVGQGENVVCVSK